MEVICPNGHHSLGTEVCSVCGARIGGGRTATATPPPNITAPVGVATGSADWSAVVSIDSSLYVTPIPNVRPPIEPVRSYPLTLDETLLGRQSDKQNVHPHIHIKDPGVSHRHLRFYKEEDGAVSVADINSMNGTKINDVEVAPGKRYLLEDGDQITIGYWTRVAIRGKRL